MLLVSSFEKSHLETMANTMSRGRDAGQPSTYHGNLRPAQVCIWRWWIGREYLVEDPLEKGIQPEYWAESHLDDTIPRSNGDLNKMKGRKSWSTSACKGEFFTPGVVIKQVPSLPVETPAKSTKDVIGGHFGSSKRHVKFTSIGLRLRGIMPWHTTRLRGPSWCNG